MDYLSGRLSNREKNLLERESHADPFDAEAFEGLSRLSATELGHDLNLLTNRISHYQKRSIRLMPLLMRVAAVLILLLVPAAIVWMLFKNDQNQQLAESNTAPLSADSIKLSKATTDTTHQIVIADNSIAPPARNTIKFTPPVIKADDEVAEDKVLREDEELVIATEAQSAVDYDKGVDDILVPITEEESAVPVAALSKTISDSADLMTMAKSEKKRSLNTNEKDKAIYGTVVDETGEPLIGVTIVLKGTTIATITDIDGKYRLEIPEDVSKPVITADFIGYDRQELAVQSDSIGKIAMKPDQLALSEVVVVGYGVAKSDEPEPSLTLARPVIGMHQYEQNLSKAVVFPAGEVKQKQVVVLRLTIDVNGNIANIVVIKSPGKAFEDEAIRVVKISGGWMAAHKGNQNIETNRRVRVLFNPDAD